MYKGTTPTFIFKLKDIDLQTAEDIAVTFQTSGKTIEKNLDDITINENEIEVYLSQEDTLSLSVGGAKAQVNILFNGGVRGCTKAINIPVKNNLKNEVMQ